jgi:N-acetylmuramoyl-L-alanine amidase
MKPLGPITHLTIHCAATPEGRHVTSTQIGEWDKAKFGQVSYHWVVELDGLRMRCLEDDELGAHVHLHNHGNIGACYVGGTDQHGNPKDTRTAAQHLSLRAIVSDYRKRFPGIIVLGHRDWPQVHKACPSFDVRTEL